MDWNAILEALGGGPGAMMIVGLIWFGWTQMKKADALTALLMERKDDEIRASERREIAVQQGLESVLRYVEQQKVQQ